MSQIDNILIQVRSKLQIKGIKLWLEPYYFAEVGSIESEIEKLAKELSRELNISVNHCKSALSELQDGAISKLESRKEFEKTGVATLNIKVVRPRDSSSIVIIKCPLVATGQQFQDKIAEKIKVDTKNMKVLSAGKVLHSDINLKEQGICNNQHLMVLVTDESKTDNNSAIYDRVRKAKEDAEMILKSNHSFFRMEDQDGNAIHLPPDEKKSIIMALALYEKGRAVMKREDYAEALVLYLEADELFSSCSSSLLDSVDNYALLNLDIVWCYLCLKSFSQLPDAERRLKICEQNFQRIYGENMDRVIALKGNSECERALIMRLHLLQGILFFHQNRRDESYEKLTVAENELKSLKVDNDCFLTLIEMGYTLAESRISLRNCNNNIEKAVNFITEKRKTKKEARKRNRQTENINKKFGNVETSDEWVNPKSIQSLISMGFDENMSFVALKMAKNDIQSAIDLLHTNEQKLLDEIQKQNFTVKDELVEQLVFLGFDPEMARIALQSALNNPEKATEILLQMQSEGNYTNLLDALTDSTNSEPIPSTSTSQNTEVLTKVKNKIQHELETLQAFNSFSEDMSMEEDEYLDLPLVHEEKILNEYKSLLEQ